MELRGWEGLSCHRGHRARTAPAPQPPPTAPSCARRPRAATSGVQRAHDDPRVIAPARGFFLLRRLVGEIRSHLAARLEAPRRAAVGPTHPPVRRVGLPARPAQVRCAVEWRSLPWASRDAGAAALRWRRRHPFPAPRPPRHGNVAVRAPMRARGYGAGLRARCQCVAERATALKARVLHTRAWNLCTSGDDDWCQAYIGMVGQSNWAIPHVALGAGVSIVRTDFSGRLQTIHSDRLKPPMTWPSTIARRARPLQSSFVSISPGSCCRAPTSPSPTGRPPTMLGLWASLPTGTLCAVCGWILSCLSFVCLSLRVFHQGHCIRCCTSVEGALVHCQMW